MTHKSEEILSFEVLAGCYLSLLAWIPITFFCQLKFFSQF
jgi:hypothetical protein